MVDIFGGSSSLFKGGRGPPGPIGPKRDRGPRGKLPKNITLLKRVTVTKGEWQTYSDKIQHSYKLGFTPFRVHHNLNGKFTTPIRIYDNKVYVSDDSGAFNIGGRRMEAYNSYLVHAEEVDPTADDGEAVGLIGPQGPRGHVGPQGKRGPQGDDGPP